MAELQYSVGNCEHDHDEYGRFGFPEKQLLYGGNWDLVATDLADEYYHNHDGWEARWPQELRIWRDGVLIAAFSIEMEMQPTFMAWARDLPEPPATIGDGALPL